MYDEELRAALAAQLAGLPPRQATVAVDRLITNYRGRTPTGAPVLRDRADATAYAAYRMPATFAAVGAALAELADRVPHWSPATHTDLGGGTGAAVWAVADTWRGSARSTVLDWAEPALALGRELAGRTLPATGWQRARIGQDLDLAASDLVTLSYVLGELTEDDRAAAVRAAAEAASVVVVVEPGTPEGYARVLAARQALVDAGRTVLAPCPHSGRCPIVPGQDWCHFSVRVARSSLHRQIKGGSLGHEDEKFSYVAAVRREDLAPPAGGAPAAAGERGSSAGPVPVGGPVPVDEPEGDGGSAPDGRPAPARVVRHPQLRKGQVLLDLCEEGGGLSRLTVTKRDKPRYRAARSVEWGDPWPPTGTPPRAD
ncbi:small ribosomal subunit Rsm22 family protein [Streptomyces sp. P38-E01]|uniref:Small ribosomal subunit Rsm22 family protein n=1 Tax=Streptomyces tardus TaxID=2780544 RepID=A0A949N5U6_9ACTN|nr:small ribosomal subunit Rsm22 family protein [Streptomyces tardus]MBU7599344.1 small ribosomal subunit Rsm22 family protein [Streptomyces tardus]